MKLYRFRSMDYLLGDEYQELEKQTIYFASPDQLNDPMEGFRDIVWRGDKIVWTNFFKNYVLCLHVRCLGPEITLSSKEFEQGRLPILYGWNHLPTPDARRLFNDVWDRFSSLPYIPEIIEALSNSNRPIRYIELKFYLQMIHPFFLPEIIDTYIAHGRIPESQETPLAEELSVRRICETILKSIKTFDEARTEDKINIALQQIAVIDYRNRLQSQRFIQQHKQLIPSEEYWNNRQIVFVDFPMVYLKELERLLGPQWYTACFMKYYYNSSVWGHYADNHKGACLIFASKTMGDSNGLELFYETGKNARAIRLSEIRYADKPDEVDFFRSIGRLTGKDAKEHWYTDEVGNSSECASHIPLDGDIDSDEMVDWRERHWSSFYRDITVKTKDWEYEQECRLILEDGLRQFDDEKDRALTYDFNSLTGVIFGLKTSDEQKLKIIDIIQRKCAQKNRTDFKFYQAYYSPETGDIRKYEIQLA
ncbi:DUF2971 domain-containing protein [Candidatus Poribacteria bacterium]|nr:MAG: DUF2971 domain-containing protein [Candidatus Poribacteria bacterium]